MLKSIQLMVALLALVLLASCSSTSTAAGAPVHIGEFGCYNQTPNDVALRWFADILALYKEFGWGYSLWEFNGVFGIVDHGRSGATYEDFHGFKVDRALLDLLLENRV